MLHFVWQRWKFTWTKINPWSVWKQGFWSTCQWTLKQFALGLLQRHFSGSESRNEANKMTLAQCITKRAERKGLAAHKENLRSVTHEKRCENVWWVKWGGGGVSGDVIVRDAAWLISLFFLFRFPYCLELFCYPQISNCGDWSFFLTQFGPILSFVWFKKKVCVWK